MPQATAELRKKFPGFDREAHQVLKKNFTEEKGLIRKKNPNYNPTRREWDAVDFLIQEFDYSCEIVSTPEARTALEISEEYCPEDGDAGYLAILEKLVNLTAKTREDSKSEPDQSIVNVVLASRLNLLLWFKEFELHPNVEYCVDEAIEGIRKHLPENVKAVCESTMTPRKACAKDCGTYAGNLGPCETWQLGGNGRCAFCDHGRSCHTLMKKGKKR